MRRIAAPHEVTSRNRLQIDVRIRNRARYREVSEERSPNVEIDYRACSASESRIDFLRLVPVGVEVCSVWLSHFLNIDHPARQGSIQNLELLLTGDEPLECNEVVVHITVVSV